MPASNRRPLLDGTDTQQALDSKQVQPEAPTQQQTQLSTPAAAANSTAFQPGFKQPCTLKGAASALYAGALGYFLGVMPAAIKYKGRQWGMIHTQGLASAQQLAVMSGIYTAVHCICQRIRMVEDGWNRGIAGCSTGLVLGWSNGPWSALQSCAGVGLISALIDLGGGVESAEARVLQPLQHSPVYSPTHYTPQQQQKPYALQQEQQGSSALADLPQPMQLLALLLGASPSSMSSGSNSTAGSSATAHATGAPDDQQPAAHAPRSSRDSKQQADPALRLGEEVQSNRIAQQQRQHRHQHESLLQHQQQQPLVSAALLGHTAAVAVQQLLAAPPLMFLGACCHPSTSMATAAADVDGCPVAAAAGKAVGSRRH